MFVLFVIFILPLVLAVLLGDIDDGAGQVGQQVLDQSSRFTGLLSHTDIEVGGSVI